MSRDFSGLWCSPKFPEVKLPGVLAIEKERIELILYGSNDFRGKPHGSDRVDTYSVLFGECHGKKITLLDSHFSWYKPIASQMHSFGVKPEIVLEGCHYETRNDIQLCRVSCNFSFLSAWMEDMSRGSVYSDLDKQLVGFDDRLAKRIEINIDEDLTISINQFLREDDAIQNRRLSYQVHHQVQFQTKAKKNIDFFIAKAHEFRRLMELGLTETVYAQFHSAHADERGGDWIFIFHTLGKNADSKNSDSFFAPATMLFDYYRLGEKEFKNIIRQWYRTLSKFGIIYDFLLDTHRWFRGTGESLTSVMFNNRVLNMLQGLEAFHTIDHPEEDETKEEFKARFKEIISSLNTKDKDWLKRRTQRATKNLEFRLHALLKQFGYMLDKCLISEAEKNEFVQKLVELRNSLSHGRHTDPYLGVENEVLYLEVKILLTTCILHKLGLNPDVIKQLLNSSSKYGHELGFCAHKRAEARGK